MSREEPQAPSRIAEPARRPDPLPARNDPVGAPVAAHGAGIVDEDAWHALVAASSLRGPARLLAEHAGFVGYANGVLSLSLSPTDEHLRGDVMVKMVADALAPTLGTAPQIKFVDAAKPAESLHQRNERARDERQATAESLFMSDPDVQRLISQHGAKVVPDSIRPFDEN